VLAPLGLDDVGRLLADALRCEPEHVRPLAQLVQEKTGGNPFFAIQFFTALAEEGLLAYDPDAAAWIWDMARIRVRVTRQRGGSHDRKAQALADTTQETVQQLACLGTSPRSPLWPWFTANQKGRSTRRYGRLPGPG